MWNFQNTLIGWTIIHWLAAITLWASIGFVMLKLVHGLMGRTPVRIEKHIADLSKKNQAASERTDNSAQ